MRPTKADEKKWQAEADLSTLLESERIMKDRTRLKAAMAVRKERMQDLENIDQKSK